MPSIAIIDDIRNKIARISFEFPQHAFDQSTVRHIIGRKLGGAITIDEVSTNDPDDQ
jgi:hypothetical protein